MKNIPDISRESIKEAWEYLKKNVTKSDVEKKADEIREYYPNHNNNEKFIYGFAVINLLPKYLVAGNVNLYFELKMISQSI